MTDTSPQALQQACIELQQRVFLRHRHAQADPTLDEEARACAAALERVDPDGCLTAGVRAAVDAFIAEELRRHPPGSIDPYADITPAPAGETHPRSCAELLALDPEDAYYIIGEQLEQRHAAGSLLTPSQALVLTLLHFDDEVQNGGVSQFFLNGGAAKAERVTDALLMVGARKIATLFSQLDPQTHDSEANAWFDEAYYRHYERAPLSRAVGRYIHKHIKEFAEE